MERDQKIIRILLHVILGSGFCILLGYFFYGTLIFRIGLTVFQFVATGIVGSIFYAFLKYWGKRAAWLSLGVLLILSLAAARVSTPLRIVSFVIAYLVIGTTMLIYSRYVVRRFSNIKVGKFIAYSVMLSVGLLISHMVYGWILQPAGFNDVLKGMSKAWLLMGAGLGLGLELAELIYPPVKQELE